MGLSVEDVKDVTWKWRCKISSLGRSQEKTAADFTSSVSATDSEDLKADVQPPASKPKTMSAGKDSVMGASPIVKTLFEGKNSTESVIDWQDYPPRQISKSAAKAQDRVAIKIYKVKDKDQPVISGHFALCYHRIDVQNPLLIAALEPILKKEDVYLDSHEVAVFKAPFRSLYFSYDEIAERHHGLTANDPLRPFTNLLLRVLDDVFAEIRTKRKQLVPKGLVSFQHAWSYFRRDSILLSHGLNCDVLCKIVDTHYKVVSPSVTKLRVRVKQLTFNGDAFVWEEQMLDIAPFDGNRPVTELRHYPLDFHSDSAGMQETMRNRGTMVLDYQGLHYALYNGIAIHRDAKGIQKHNVDSRILIDVVGHNKHHLQLGSRETQDPETARNAVAGTGRAKDGMDSAYMMIGRAAARNRAAAITTATNISRVQARLIFPKVENEPPKGAKATGVTRLTEADQKRNKDVMLKNPDELMFMSPLVQGYAMKNKLWLEFYVEDIRPMEWNEQAYDHLVYDEQQKDLVLSFVESHGQAAPQVKDVIMGKGSGLIILLSGPPGTGKTLTAEAVADRTRRPLFYLQAEDLGINAAALGANVKKVFEMATEWDAVVLLDEADVFMAERHPQDIARNELVSIFLRELEYFKGIIFLTTNLYDTIDKAFRSRVSLHLLFAPLSADARLAVWRKFLDRLPPAPESAKEKQKLLASASASATGDGEGDDEKEGLSEDDLTELSAWTLNGREIKTAVKMVKAWVDHKGYKMNLLRLENGIKVTSPHAIKTSNVDDTDLYD